MSPATRSNLPQYPIPPIPPAPICAETRSGPTCVPDYSQIPRAQWDNYGWSEEDQRFVCCQPADICNPDGSLFIPKGLVKSINQVRREAGEAVEMSDNTIDLNVWTGAGLYAPVLSEKMQKVAAGEWEGLYPSRSEAVSAVLVAMAGAYDCDRYRMREEFESTRLCQMWNETGKWERLGERELDRAIKYVETHEQPRATEQPKPAAPIILTFKSMASVKPEAIDWLWKGYLATGKLTTLNGEPGGGKSLVSLDVAARVTRGRDWPDGSKNPLPASRVLIVTVEEDAADTIRPRFDVAGGDVHKLDILEVNGGDGLFQIEKHADQLEAMLRDKGFKLVILDPMMDFTKAQQNVDGEVRPVLNRLVRLAGDCELAVCGISHFNKKSDLAAMHRVAGARAWTSVARLNFIVGKGESADVRHLVALKNNLAKEGGSLDFAIDEVAHGLVMGGYPRAKWIGKGNTTADEITATKPPQKENDSVTWLRELLSPPGGKKPLKEIEEAATDLFNYNQISKAGFKLKVLRERVGMPAVSVWSLPIQSIPSPSQSIREGEMGWTS